MTYASYERQHLAVYAAGFISAAGTTRAGFGMELTRVTTGVYAAVFGVDDGLVNDDSYTFVTAKNDLGASGVPPVTLQVEDTSNLVKTIFVSGILVPASPLGTVVIQDVNSDLEVAIYRTVAPNA